MSKFRFANIVEDASLNNFCKRDSTESEEPRKKDQRINIKDNLSA